MVRLRPQLGLLAALPLLLACDSPTEPGPGPVVPSDPFHAELTARLDALGEPGVDPARRQAESPMYEALIDLFERAEAAQAVIP